MVRDARGAWRAALEKTDLGGRGIRMYDVRHLYGTLGLASGADPVAIQHQMGHSSLSTTLGNYAHLLP